MTAVLDLDVALADLQARVHTAKLARVVAFDDATSRATVQYVRRPRTRRGLPILQPPIPAIPVFWPNFGGVTFRGTLVPGDDVLLIVLDRDHSPYFTAPGGFDAASERMHDQSDAIAIPFSWRLGQAPGVVLRIGRDDGTSTITITPTTLQLESTLVRLGQAAALGAVRDAGGLAGAITAAVTALSTITAAPIPEPPAPGAGAAIDAMAAALLALVQALAVSTKVVVE